MDKNLDIYDIYGFYYKPFWQTTNFKIIISLVILLILFIISFFVYKFFLKKRLTLTAWDWAFDKLKKLSIDKLNKKSDFKFFYFELTNIIKLYLLKRYSWDVKYKTDEELIILLKEKNFDSILIKYLQDINSSSLYVKFADETVLKNQAEIDLKKVFEFIEKTRPLENK